MTPYLNGDTDDHTERIAHHGVEDREPVAIIGLAMRAADEANDTEAFWHFLLKARQATRPIPEDRISSKAFYHPDPDHGGTVCGTGIQSGL
jgi:acyl transferase domain-containing protein